MKQKDEFLAKLKEIYFWEDLKLCEKAFEIEKRKTCFRINTLKSDESEIFEVLGKQGLKAQKIDFLKNWYFLENWKEKDLWDLNIFKDGKIYLQSLSSQIPVDFLGLEFGDKILDITASPGGKTSQAQSLLNNSWEIKAIDNNQIRIDKLKFTLERQWIKNVEIIKTDVRSLLEKRKDFVEYFDKIITDYLLIFEDTAKILLEQYVLESLTIPAKYIPNNVIEKSDEIFEKYIESENVNINYLEFIVNLRRNNILKVNNKVKLKAKEKIECILSLSTP